MEKSFIFSIDQLGKLFENDITLQTTANNNTIEDYKKSFNTPDTQSQIKQADSFGNNVDVKITNSKKDNGMTLSVDGKNGLDNANGAMQTAINSGASVVVSNANKINETFIMTCKQLDFLINESKNIRQKKNNK